jgi:ABC-type multidrug transport system ATPase subunit
MAVNKSGEAFLSALRSLPPTAHGPRVDISYQNLDHIVDVPIIQTGLTNLAESVGNFITGPFRKSDTRRMQVLDKMTGTFKAGTATLLIGNAGSGKSTFLSLLAGREKAQNPQSVFWNGKNPHVFSDAKCSKIATVAPQIDVHEPLLSVRESFEFAAKCCLAPLGASATVEEKNLREKLVDFVIDTLGLRECETVSIGDDMTRGVSGGQKKRVTIGEALLTGSRVLCLDEITNGLDAAIASEIIAFLVEWAHVTGGTVICTLQAPTPEVFNAFDEVLLLSDGHELYHGEPSKLSPYLASLGFHCPHYTDIADFALSFCVSPTFTAKSQASQPKAEFLNRTNLAQHWQETRTNLLKSTNIPSTLSDGGVLLSTDLDKAQFGKGTVHDSLTHLSLLLTRQSKLVSRNPAVSIGRIMQFIILASIFGSIYWKLDVDNFVTKISMVIFAASSVSFASFAEIPAIFVGKRTAARQLNGAFYTPLSYVLSVFVSSLPIGCFSTALFATIMYWMCGFAEDAGRYFFFVFGILCHELATAALFRFYAFFWSTQELAQASAGITTGSLLVFGGFYIAYPLIPNYMLSIYYISPFSWTVRSIVYSELTSSPYQTTVCVPGSLGPFVQPDPCLALKSDVYLDAFGFFKSSAWQWGGCAYCVAFSIVFGVILSTIAVTFFRYKDVPGSQRISEASFLSAATASADSIKASSSVTDLVVQSEEFSMKNPAVIVPVQINSTTASSTLPFTPVTLSFEDITYEVTLPDKTNKTLLRGISGFARPGTLTALMGASGAGKTTLLDVLAFKKTTGKVTGKTLLNGSVADNAAFIRLSGFAEQQDIHVDYQTVREAISFSAHMRLPRNVSVSQRSAFVDEVIRLLELEPIKSRRTGSLSQGELKRLTIAVELAANPAVLFLDEPTTGLDSRAAAIVMRVIRNVANTGRSVVATIHQPSAEVFFGFDNLICLVPGGYEAYVGPLGKEAQELVSFLSGIPGVKPLPDGVNAATWMLTEMNALAEANKERASEDKAIDVPSYYRSSSLYSSNKAALEDITSTKTDIPTALTRPTLLESLGALLYRMALYSWRNTAWNGVRLFTFLTLSIFFGLLYLKIDDSTYAGAFSKLAVALNGLLFLSIINLNSSSPNYSRMRASFYRERSSQMYPAIVYPISNLLVEIPWSAFYCLLFTAVNYHMVGFKTDAASFFISVLATFLAALWFATLSMGFIAFFPVELLANIAGGPTIQISILFAGVNLSRSDLPAAWRFLYDADGFAHALRLFFLPQYDGDKTIIKDRNPSLTMTREAFSYFRLGVKPDEKWNELGYLLAILSGAIVLMILFTVKINHQKR